MTGWCTPGNAPWQHKRCSGQCAGVACDCDWPGCHNTPDAPPELESAAAVLGRVRALCDAWGDTNTVDLNPVRMWEALAAIVGEPL